jgi:hypothetical protein
MLLVLTAHSPCDAVPQLHRGSINSRDPSNAVRARTGLSPAVRKQRCAAAAHCCGGERRRRRRASALEFRNRLPGMAPAGKESAGVTRGRAVNAGNRRRGCSSRECAADVGIAQADRLEPYGEQVTTWLQEEHSQLTRVQELLGQRGVHVPYTTLERFVWRLGHNCAADMAIRSAWHRRRRARWPRWISNTWGYSSSPRRAVVSGSGPEHAALAQQLRPRRNWRGHER